MSFIADTITTIQQKLAIMPDRDKNALKVLAIFFIFMLFYAVYAFHSYANKVENSYLNTEQQLFWLRGQSGNIVNNSNKNEDITATINNFAQMQNIDIEVVENGGSIQFTAKHDNAVVLGSFMERLEEVGLAFQQVDMQQKEGQQIELTVIANS